MLTVNLDVSAGLVNGSIGVIKSLIMKNSRVKVIYVKFNVVSTTQSLCSNSRDDELNGTVGIRRHQSKILI